MDTDKPIGRRVTDDTGRTVYLYEFFERDGVTYERMVAHFNYGDIHRRGRSLSSSPIYADDGEVTDRTSAVLERVARHVAEHGIPDECGVSEEGAP